MATRYFASALTKTVQAALKPVVVVPKQSVHTIRDSQLVAPQCPPLKADLPKPVKPSYPPPPKTKKTQAQKKFDRYLKECEKAAKKEDKAFLS